LERASQPLPESAVTPHEVIGVGQGVPECIDKGGIRRLYFRAPHRAEFQAADSPARGHLHCGKRMKR